MDVTSGGELFRALKAGCDPQKIFFAGVGKTDREIHEALRRSHGRASAPSTSSPKQEFWNLDRLAGEMGVTAHAALRVNPDLQNRSTHNKTFTARKEDKFGINIDRAADFYRQASKAKHVRLHGLHLHIGSPIKFTEPYAEAITKALALIDALANDGIAIETLDLGGGFAAFYEGNEAPPFTAYADAIVPLLQDRVAQGLQVILEPGRSIVCNAAILLAQVQYTKQAGAKKYVIVDAGMNDLIRPTLYESYHFIWPVATAAGLVPPTASRTCASPAMKKSMSSARICESGDYLAKDRYLPPLQARRPAGGLLRRRLRHGDELQLQRPPPRRGSPGRRRHYSHHPPPRNLRRPHPQRDLARAPVFHDGPPQPPRLSLLPAGILDQFHAAHKPQPKRQTLQRHMHLVNRHQQLLSRFALTPQG